VIAVKRLQFGEHAARSGAGCRDRIEHGRAGGFARGGAEGGSGSTLARRAFDDAGVGGGEVDRRLVLLHLSEPQESGERE
jgi:hypothetical protein